MAWTVVKLVSLVAWKGWEVCGRVHKREREKERERERKKERARRVASLTKFRMSLSETLTSLSFFLSLSLSLSLAINSRWSSEWESREMFLRPLKQYNQWLFLTSSPHLVFHSHFLENKERIHSLQWFRWGYKMQTFFLLPPSLSLFSLSLSFSHGTKSRVQKYRGKMVWNSFILQRGFRTVMWGFVVQQAWFDPECVFRSPDPNDPCPKGWSLRSN